MHNDNDYEYILEEAQDHLNQTNYEQCIAICQTIIDKDPENEYANILSAICYQKLKQHERAIVLFEKFPDNTKSQAATWRWYALALFNAGYYDKAEEVFLQVYKAYPKDGDVCYSFGYFRLFKNQYTEAIELFNKSAAIGMLEMHLLHYDRGVAYYNLNNLDAALLDMEKTLEILPEYSQASVALAEIYNKKGKYDIALEYYSRALYYAPDNRKLRFERLRFLLNQKDKEGNITHLQMAQQDADKLTPNMHEFITLKNKEGEHQKAIKVTITEKGAINFQV